MKILNTSKDYLDEAAKTLVFYFEMLSAEDNPLTQDQAQEVKSIVDLIAVGVLKSLKEGKDSWLDRGKLQ